jgi:molecular chaperone GrpE
MKDENKKNSSTSANEIIDSATAESADVSSADDVTFEEDSDSKENTGKDYRDEVKKLKAKIAELSLEKQKYLDGWQRDKAEFINARKRDKEAENMLVKFAAEGLINDILPTLESFDLAIGNKAAWEKVDKNWRIGVEYIYGQLLQTLVNAGLAEINPVGTAFDPARDEASEYVPVETKNDDHKIISVKQKGYTLNGKILRAPKVVIGEYTQK